MHCLGVYGYLFLFALDQWNYLAFDNETGIYIYGL